MNPWILSNTFAPVIRASTRDERPTPRTQRRWFIALGSRTVSSPPWSLWLRPGTFVLVTNRLDPTAVKQGAIDVRVYPEPDRVLTLRIHYRARAIENEEQRVVEMLGSRDDPEGAFHDFVSTWVNGALRHPGIDDVDDPPAALYRWLRDHAKAKLGLDVETTMAKPSENLAKAVALSLNVVVRPRDTPRQNVAVRMDVSLTPARWYERYALEAKNWTNALENALVEAAQEALNNVRYHDLLFGNASATILPDSLSRIAATFGYRVQHARLTPPATDRIVPIVTLQHPFEYRHREARDAVMIVSDVQLELADAGKWVSNGSPNPYDWARQAVEATTREVLFSLPDSAFLLGFESQRESLRDKINSTASEVGYRVLLFHTVTSLQVDLLKATFTVSAGGDFVTGEADVRAPLDIAVEARIPTTHKIERLLEREASVVDAMRMRINHAVAALLRGVRPEDFYLRFDTRTSEPAVAKGGNPDALLEGETLRARLERVIRRELEGNFDAETLQVTLRYRRNPIFERLDALMNTAHRFALTVAPADGLGLKPVFIGTFVVEAVDARGWSLFVRSLPSVDQVIATVENCLQARLAEVSTFELRPFDTHLLEAATRTLVQRSVLDAHGLVVQILDWSRIPSYELLLLAEPRLLQSDLTPLASEINKKRADALRARLAEIDASPTTNGVRRNCARERRSWPPWRRRNPMRSSSQALCQLDVGLARSAWLKSFFICRDSR